MDDNVVKCLLAVVAVVLVGYLIMNYMDEQSVVEQEQVSEGFDNNEEDAEAAEAKDKDSEEDPKKAEGGETPAEVEEA